MGIEIMGMRSENVRHAAPVRPAAVSVAVDRGAAAGATNRGRTAGGPGAVAGDPEFIERNGRRYSVTALRSLLLAVEWNFSEISLRVSRSYRKRIRRRRLRAAAGDRRESGAASPAVHDTGSGAKALYMGGWGSSRPDGM